MRLHILIAMSVILAGCGQVGPRTVDVDYHTGTDGLALDLISESSLDNIYENATFSVNYVVENKGAYDVIGEEQGIFTMSFDPFYIDASNIKENSYLSIEDGTITMKGIKLAGKSKYYPTGTDLFLYFPGLKAKSILGQRAEPETQIFSSLCYPYQTTMSRLVCVDFSVYDQDLRSQVCRQADLSLSGQGAPVSVSRVEVDNQPAGNNLVRPVFIVHVSNDGKGSVLSPVTSSEELERVCAATDLSRQDFNTVKVEAMLSESTQLECSPEVVRLNQGQGLTRCTVRDEELERTISYRQNYQAPLTVKLSYVYLSTHSKDIEIERVDYYPGSVEPGSECLAHEIRQGSECVSRCEYCTQRPGSAECQPSGLQHEIAFDNSFSCACGQKECNDRLYALGLCVPTAGFCPAASYCCSKPCKSTEVRGDDGKCYPKCSTCSEASDACVCGDEGAVMEAGGFCCPSASQGFGTADQCNQECG